MNKTANSTTAANIDTALPVLGDQRARLKSILETRPLYIAIETTNICNAKCVFCAYPKMSRPKAVMDLDLFHKIIQDYSEMGGGAVSLTPIVGDALIDPHILDRLRALKDHPDITHVSLITNAIAWSRFSADQQEFIVTALDGLAVSMGGPDAESYARMYGVDRFDRVAAAVESICDIKAKLELDTEINLMFRVDRPTDELLSDERMAVYRRPEINEISSLNRFGNWGGMIESSDLPQGAHLIQPETDRQRNLQQKTNPCFVFHLAPEIAASGLVSACGCMNAEVKDLVIGDIKHDHLRDIWNGPAFRKLKSDFGTDRLCDTCFQCTYYSDGEAFLANPALKHFKVGDNPWQVMRQNKPESALEQMTRTLDSIVSTGGRRVALYGAGAFTRKALDAGLDPSHLDRIVAIIDDNPELSGDRIQGKPVTSQADAIDLDLDVVILSTDHFVDELRRQSRTLRESGISIVAAGELVTDRAEMSVQELTQASL